MASRNGWTLVGWLEDRLPGYRYGAVLALLFTTYVFMATGPTHVVARVVTIGLQGATLLAALLASRAGRRLFVIAAVVVSAAFIAALASVFVSSSMGSSGWFLALNVLLVAACPVVIARALLRRRTVDVETVLGAICIYVLIGMCFSFVYSAIGLFEGTFFVQTKHANLADYLYFSFVTQTTVGYGDFSAAGGLGRALAAFEGMLGQLYLVTVVAVVVSNLAGARRGRPPEEQVTKGAGDEAGDRSPGDRATR